MQDAIGEQTRELPEIQLPVVVFFHCNPDDEAELRSRIDQIRHTVETALADDDNDLRDFTYPEVRIGDLTVTR